MVKQKVQDVATTNVQVGVDVRSPGTVVVAGLVLNRVDLVFHKVLVEDAMEFQMDVTIATQSSIVMEVEHKVA